MFPRPEMANALEVDISQICLRWKIGNAAKCQDVYSSEFRFKSGGWKLNYYKFGEDCGLYLCKCSGVAPDTLQVSVTVERSSEDGRAVEVLPQEKSFTGEFEEEEDCYLIWWKEKEEILRALPEFHLRGVLRLIVVLKIVEEKDSVATQTEGSIPEGVELSCVESILEDFQRMMIQDSDCDVEFRCADQSFKAHGAVVCARSSVICTMLASDMGSTRIVNIPGMTPEVFQVFLGYLYTGKLPKLSFEVAMSLYQSGDHYAVLGLAKRCRKYLVEHLTVQNACNVLIVADAHSDEDFAEKVFEYMLESKVPQNSDSWSAFADDHPQLAIKVLKRGWDAWAPI